jgi:hypothetical protein
VAAETLADEPAKKKTSEGKNATRAAPCGLYCGACGAYARGTCHGCGCECGDCAGKRAKWCDIAQCAGDKGLDTCASCPDVPCTRVIQFTCDPVWRTHTPCIENLRRQKLIGIEAWLEEQKTYWSDERKRKRWLALQEECSKREKTFAK